MNEEISIKVNIADVVYPLKVALSDEESVRKAAKMINDRVKTYKDDFHITDKANLLSMVALQFASELLQNQAKSQAESNELTVNILKINKLLEECIQA